MSRTFDPDPLGKMLVKPNDMAPDQAMRLLNLVVSSLVFHMGFEGAAVVLGLMSEKIQRTGKQKGDWNEETYQDRRKLAEEAPWPDDLKDL